MEASFIAMGGLATVSLQTGGIPRRREVKPLQWWLDKARKMFCTALLCVKLASSLSSRPPMGICVT